MASVSVLEPDPLGFMVQSFVAGKLSVLDANKVLGRMNVCGPSMPDREIQVPKWCRFAQKVF